MGTSTPGRNIDSVEALLDRIEQGLYPEFIFFWEVDDCTKISKQCLSQWFYATFEVNGISYLTAEHYMMAEKARVFGDEEICRKILQISDPGDVVNLGRQVRNFDTKVWEQRRLDVVLRGNEAKFSQNPALLEFLRSTGDKILVDSSFYDTIWGVGLEESDPRIFDPRQWKGLNLLGFALMAVRSRLMER